MLCAGRVVRVVLCAARGPGASLSGAARAPVGVVCWPAPGWCGPCGWCCVLAGWCGPCGWCCVLAGWCSAQPVWCCVLVVLCASRALGGWLPRWVLGVVCWAAKSQLPVPTEPSAGRLWLLAPHLTPPPCSPLAPPSRSCCCCTETINTMAGRHAARAMGGRAEGRRAAGQGRVLLVGGA
jgi:hypothetical protein